ncbi:hypothetical protein RHIZ_02975 [Rhizobium skierniewicense]|uniref:hypothetical protein n=1 Tax=Rhizobium skierniewicense TaxID=984260 RepID=UPI001FAB65C9|nr:hypothetical protein [Rhizobium skierniewicense]MCI9864903.1 hypothetical protein [Rhizobium skierniewicense]
MFAAWVNNNAMLAHTQLASQTNMRFTVRVMTERMSIKATIGRLVFIVLLLSIGGILFFCFIKTAPISLGYWEQIFRSLTAPMSRSDPWRQWLYDFQGLIGGVLAVAAGVGTVIQMRMSDSLATQHHIEGLEVQRQQTASLIERALNPSIRSLESTFDYLDATHTEILSRNTFEGQKSLIRERVYVLESCFNDLIELFDRQQLREADNLFPGLLSYKIGWVKRKLETGHPHLKKRKLEFNLLHAPRQPIGESWEEEIYQIINAVVAELPTVVDLMRQLAAKHDVQVL